MRNYVIINGVNSLTIQGLAINNLPPITKPMIRTQREEIDGRDGDIVTELGYSAYDKQIEIGLWGTYDINDIIKYFTGEGTIVFSNEEDKYYNFKILDQIDYQKLLKFKTATVTFHCQPFKYPVEEEPVEAEITTLTGTGETITLNNTEEAPMSLVYKGNTYQDSTTGTNLLYYPYVDTPNSPKTVAGVTWTDNGDGSITARGTATGYSDFALTNATKKLYVQPNTTYRLSGIPSSAYLVYDCYEYDTNNTQIAQHNNIRSSSFTTNSSASWLQIIAKRSTNASIDATIYPQLELGSSQTEWVRPTEGQGSPSPSYPQPIHVVSGDNSIVVCGKNLFNKTTTTTGKLVSRTDGTLVNNASYQASDYIPVKANTTYYQTKCAYYYSVYYDRTKTFTGICGTQTFTPTQDGYIRTTIANADIDTAQVEVGSSATTYEPYTGESYPISLSSNLLYNVSLPKYQAGVIADYINGIFKLSGTSTNASNLYIIPYTSSLVHVEAGESITFYIERVSGTSVVKFMTYFYPDDGTSQDYTWGVTLNANTSSNKVVKTATKSGTLKNVQFFIDNSTTYDSEVKILVKKGNIENPTWAEYITPIELLKIGTYQDRIFKNTPNTTDYDSNLEDNLWYLKKEIGKVDLGTLTWISETSYLSGQFRTHGANLPNLPLFNGALKCNQFIWQEGSVGSSMENGKIAVTNSQTTPLIRARWEDYNSYSASEFKDAMSGNMLYYQMLTPTYTLIEDSTLIEELESMKKSKEGQTNISQTNNDLPFELDVSVTFLTPMEINNIGNIYAKPILTIEGTGNIGVVLNDIQILDIDLTNNGKIAIDVPKLEAYNPDDDTLLNRLVTGDYMKLLINEGENTITFTGNVSGATLTNYIRWI